MAYQNPGTPRFYISIFQWLHSLGVLESASSNYTDQMSGKPEYELIEINPTKPFIFTTGGNVNWSTTQIYALGYKIKTGYGSFSDYMPMENNFSMILGHTLKDSIHDIRNWGGQYETLAHTPLVNGDNPMEKNGFSIRTGNDGHNLDSTIAFRLAGYYGQTEYKMGSWLYGTYFDISHSPTLGLKINVDMDGVNMKRSKSGSDLNNYNYTKSPAWDNNAPWNIGGSDYEMSRIGRRSWDLQFSYLSDVNLSGVNHSIANNTPLYNIEGYNTDYYNTVDNTYYDNISKDNSFFSQVIMKTNGGQLPFVFQPDNTNNNPDSFAICKFDQNSFDFKQVASGVYDISLKIREIW